MRSFTVDDKYLYFSKTLTQGTQRKYLKDNYYYKINKNGNEGFTEYLISRLLCNSNVPSSLFVKYEYCTINNRLGCRSKNFLSRDEEFITMSSLYKKKTGGKVLSDKLQLLPNSKARLDYILSIIDNNHNGLDVKSFKNYLNILMLLDFLVLNTDRHEHNYGIIYNYSLDKARPCIIFDNGLSLNTDKLGNATSCTLSGSFAEQLIAFGYPITSNLKFNYEKVFADLIRIEKLYGKHAEIDLLRSRLLEYKNLYSM